MSAHTSNGQNRPDRLIVTAVLLLCGILMCSAVGTVVLAGAAPLGPRSYPLSIGNAIGCKICQSIASHVLIHIQLYMDRHGKTTVAQYEVEDFLEHICDPNNIAGAWIRRIGLDVVPDDPTNATSRVHLEVKELNGYAKCQRACVTVRDYCVLTKEHTHFDALIPEVASLSVKSNGGRLATQENVQYLQDRVCKRFYACMNLDRIMISAARDLNNKENLRRLMETDVVELLPPEELAKSLTAYNSQKNHSLVGSELTPEELEKLQSALSFDENNKVSRGANAMYQKLVDEQAKKNSDTSAGKGQHTDVEDEERDL